VGGLRLRRLKKTRERERERERDRDANIVPSLFELIFLAHFANMPDIFRISRRIDCFRLSFRKIRLKVWTKDKGLAADARKTTGQPQPGGVKMPETWGCKRHYVLFETLLLL
jgi:hypothetical protein